MLEVFLVGAALVLGVMAVGARIQFLHLREDVARQRAEVKSALARRIDLVNRMLEVALHYEAYERDIIEMVTRSAGQRSAAIGPIVAHLSTAYPQLRASEQYQELMRQVASQEQDAKEALAAYNNAAALHNTATGRLPWNLLWASERLAYLDISMERELLPARWDTQRLKFTLEDKARPSERARIAGS